MTTQNEIAIALNILSRVNSPAGAKDYKIVLELCNLVTNRDDLSQVGRLIDVIITSLVQRSDSPYERDNYLLAHEVLKHA